MHIETFFEAISATFCYLVIDENTRKAAIIDSVLGYDQYSGICNTEFADKIIAYVLKHELKIEWILDTHIHADHITAASYLKNKLGGKIAIGAEITKVLDLWIPIFDSESDTAFDGSQFDRLLEDNEVIELGSLKVLVMHTPGHTPACASYLIKNAIFVGDTLFMPDVGTARTDFPGGSALEMYNSVRKILSLPEDTKIYTCHDYPENGRVVSGVSTVKEQISSNIMINAGVSESEYVVMRNNRDKGKPVPKMLLPSIQTNLRAGGFGSKSANGQRYIKIPVNNRLIVGDDFIFPY